MFIDSAKIHLKAGAGGDGCNSLYRDRVIRRGRPDGGSGGDGGDIIMQADKNKYTLLDFHYNRHYNAEDGRNGGSNHKQGKRGKNRIILVPPGTLIYDQKANDLLRDLEKDGDSLRVCRGGAGGKGNARHRDATPGASGEEKEVRLELKLIADVGIVGFPNAGKSTLISKISGATPKIACYPFTTREPVPGVVRFGESDFVVVDIPGIMEGAHLGRGLGDKFLRHVERTKYLIHLIDMAAVDCRDPVSDYRTLNSEISQYSQELFKKPQFIVANKMDLPEAKKNLKEFKRSIKKKIFLISAIKGEGLSSLLGAICKKIDKEKGRA